LDGQQNFPVFVAVVDDEIDLAILFKEALSQIPNVQVFAFSDSLLAFEHFQYNQKKYRCIVSDYRMPGLNGVELLSKVKQINSEVASILISAFEIDDEVFKNCNCIDKFLQKPIKIANMIEVIQNYLNSIRIKEADRE
jgi:DNA-binding NtrC family response regulator